MYVHVCIFVSSLAVESRMMTEQTFIFRLDCDRLFSSVTLQHCPRQIREQYTSLWQDDGIMWCVLCCKSNAILNKTSLVKIFCFSSCFWLVYNWVTTVRLCQVQSHFLWKWSVCQCVIMRMELRWIICAVIILYIFVGHSAVMYWMCIVLCYLL